MLIEPENSLTISVLPPISTEGMTADDVTSLTESTRDSMSEALKDISQPDPRHFAPQPAISGSATPTTDTPAQNTEPEQSEHDGLRIRKIQSSTGSEGGQSRNSEDGTEDEMDEDAVLLKRPKDSEL